MKCPKCNTEVGEGAKFCPNCGQHITRETVVENPVCPKCGKKFPNGIRFCDVDGCRLVAEGSIKYRCEKCGKEYPKSIKFCSEDGGRVLPSTSNATKGESSKREQEFIDGVDRVVGTAVSKGLEKFNKLSDENHWSGWVTALLIISLAINGYYILDISRTCGLFNEVWLIATFPILIVVLGIIMLFCKRKSGFYILCFCVLVKFVLTILYPLFFNYATIIRGLVSIAAWYGILQIRRDGVSAWETLK